MKSRQRPKSIRTHGSAATDETWATRLGSAVRARRTALRLTQAEVWQLARCSPAFLYQLEQGKESLRFGKVLDVLNVLGLQLTVEPGQERLAVRGLEP
jgi:HTH-type transcriptional regulator / antitoxin HipB